MDVLQAIILGIIQGLTEFLPVSSSGHLELGNALLDIQVEENLTFALVVHGATVLSTVVVFWKDIVEIVQGVFEFKWNASFQFVLQIGISMIPVAIVGLFFKDQIESLFTGNIRLVGSMLLFTAVLLGMTYFSKEKNKSVGFISAFIIGCAQAVAVLPGISRSGSTIATAILLGINKEKAARFSFLMVLVPILMANLMDLMDIESSSSSVGTTPLIAGFIAAFLSGLFACKAMIKLVKRNKLIYFSVYCLLVGIIALVLG